jgi:hypothetical protein
MGHWLRENACLIEGSLNSFRFPIGRRIGSYVFFGSVEQLKIGSVAGKSMTGVCGAYLVRIL